MVNGIPIEGSVSVEIAENMHRWWTESATAAGVDLTGFDPQAPLASRIAWARQRNLLIGGALARFSTKLQHSTDAQLQQNVEWGARNGCYVVPEYTCVDEATSGRKSDRVGLERMKQLLAAKHIEVLLVYKVSRLLRVAYKGFAFFQENVVDAGLRAVSVSQGIDTADRQGWKAKLSIHGLMDDMLLDTIGDHVRVSQHNLFAQGYTTGALTVGYVPEEVPGATLTNRGLPRTRPAVDKPTAAMIVKHFELIRDGLPIAQGWKRWVAEGGPCDPRATTKQMNYPCYRAMLSNRRYTGLWAFGRKKNEWLHSRDRIHQVEQPESEVRIIACEDLRIVSDELFEAVQHRLATHELGPRAPRKGKATHLCDLTTGLFYCAICSTEGKPIRYYQTGAHGAGMQCKRGHQCQQLSAVRRQEAVAAVCVDLQQRLKADKQLIVDIVCQAQLYDAEQCGDREKLIHQQEGLVRTATQRISDLQDLLGSGSEDDRREVKAKIKAAQADRYGKQLELQRLQAADVNLPPITPQEVEEILAELEKLLTAAANGELGEDVIHWAYSVFELLVGGSIMVHIEPRAGRKQTNARGVYRPDLISAVRKMAGRGASHRPESNAIAEVWLREPPFVDRWASRAYELCDVQGQSYRMAAKTMNREDGLDINSGKVWQLRARYYEMKGLPSPPRSYNNGHRRESA